MTFTATNKDQTKEYSATDYELPDKYIPINEDTQYIDEFYCKNPACRKKVYFKPCVTKKPHFAHYDGDCLEKESDPETKEHEQMKTQICKLLKLDNDFKEKPLKTKDIEYDHNYGDIKIRSDIYFETKDGLKFAVECQNTNNGISDLIERTKKYSKIGVYVLWVINTHYCKNSFKNKEYSIENAKEPERWLDYQYGMIYIWDDDTQCLNRVNLNTEVIEHEDEEGAVKSWKPIMPEINKNVIASVIPVIDYIINPNLSQEQTPIPFFKNNNSGEY